MSNEIINTEYWNKKYLDHTHTWDIGYVSTPLKEYIDQLTDNNISILIPGCGNAYEAQYLLDNNFTNITLVDISPVLVENLKEKLKDYPADRLKIICGDFFDLDEQFDLIIEQTFFCALDPKLREDYVAKMQSLLKPGGKLVGLMFNRSFDESPPFGGSKAEYEKLFQGKLEIKKMEACYNSIERRSGSELFVILKKV